MSPAKSLLGSVWVVAAVTALGLVLRLHGIDFMLPQSTEPDGKIVLRQVELIRSGDPHPEHTDDWVRYPLLVARAAAIVPHTDAPAPSDADVAAHLRAASAPHVELRTVVALLSVAIVPLTWLLARRFLGPKGSLLAVAWMATSLLDTWFAQQARPHAPAATFATGAVLAAIHLAETGTLRAHLFAGIAAGLAIGALQSGLAVLCPLALATVLAHRRARWPRSAAACAWIGAGAVALYFYPFLLAPARDIPTPIFEPGGGRIEFFGHTVVLEHFNGSGFGIVFGALWSFEPIAVILAAIELGFFAARIVGTAREHAVRLSRDVWVVLAYVVPYVIVTGLYQRSFERFALQLLPYLYCLAALGLASLFAWATRRRAPTACVWAVAIVCVCLPAMVTTRLVQLRGEPDTMTRAAAWIATHAASRNAPPRIGIIPVLDLPLLRTSDALTAERDLGWTTPWRKYRATVPDAARSAQALALYTVEIARQKDRNALEHDTIRHLRGLGLDWVAIALPYSTFPRTFADPVRAALCDGAPLLARFPPGATGTESDVALSYTDKDRRPLVPWAIPLLTEIRMAGPVIEIYGL